MIRVACVSDVHTKLYIDLFEKALREVDFDKVDIFLFAGDMIYKGNVEDLFKIIAVSKRWGLNFRFMPVLVMKNMRIYMINYVKLVRIRSFFSKMNSFPSKSPKTEKQ